MWVIVVAGGTGSRFGGSKQFEELGGRRVVDWAIEASHSVATGVVVVVPDSPLGASPPVTPGSGADVVVAGGPTRSASVRAGLAAVPEEAEVIVIHDAARPLASAGLFAAVVAALSGGADGAVPALALVDTVKRVHQGVVVGTLDRTELVVVQTPQAFRAGPLRAAHSGSAEATDDSGLVEAAGGRVVVVPGEATNTKITSPADLAMARAAVAQGPAGAVGER